MYKAECTYKSGGSGLLFFPKGGDRGCSLRVLFTPKAYYPAERDTGQGADFDADIHSIDIKDFADGEDPRAWHPLKGADLWAAKCFLNAHHRDPMWAQAEAETAEAFGVETYQVAA